MDYENYIKRQQVKYGAKFDTSELDQRFVEYFNNRRRIKVDTYGMTLTGTIGVTSGWRPAFLLMRTSRSTGSSWLMSPRVKIIAVQYGRKYTEIE